jgi:vacuolar-type H+-ATPase subunit H
MDKDILRRVVEVEKDIQERLANEKRKAGERTQEARRNAEHEVHAEEARLADSFTTTVKEAQVMARKKASEALKDARSFAKTIDTLDDDIVLGVLLRHLDRILPGE